MVLRRKLWHLVSQTINSIFGGDPDETLSARAYREGWSHKIDRWLGEGHCNRVWQEQRKRERARWI